MSPKLSALLVQDRIVSFRQMDAAVQRQKRFGGRIGTNLLELALVDEQTLSTYLERQRRVPVVTRRMWNEVQASASRNFSRDDAERLQALPIGWHGERVVVAVVDTPDTATVEEIERLVGGEVDFYLALEFRFRQAVARLYDVELSERYRRIADHQGATVRVIRERPGLRPSTDRPAVVRAPVFDPSAGVPGLEWSVAELTSFYATSASRDEVLLATLGFIGKFLQRRAIMVVGRTAIRKFAVQGFDEEEIAHTPFSLDVADDSALDPLCRGESYFLGQPEELGLDAFYQALSIDAPHDCVVVPVKVGPRAAVLMVGDNHDQPLSPASLPILFVVANQLAAALLRLIRDQKLRHTQAIPLVQPTRVAHETSPEVREEAQRIISALSGREAEIERGFHRIPTDGWDLPDLEQLGVDTMRMAPVSDQALREVLESADAPIAPRTLQDEPTVELTLPAAEAIRARAQFDDIPTAEVPEEMRAKFAAMAEEQAVEDAAAEASQDEAPADEPEAAEASQDEAPADEPEAAEASQDEAPADEPEAAEASQDEAPAEEPEAAEASQDEAPADEPEAAEASQDDGVHHAPTVPRTEPVEHEPDLDDDLDHQPTSEFRAVSDEGWEPSPPPVADADADPEIHERDTSDVNAIEDAATTGGTMRFGAIEPPASADEPPAPADEPLAPADEPPAPADEPPAPADEPPGDEAPPEAPPLPAEAEHAAPSPAPPVVESSPSTTPMAPISGPTARHHATPAATRGIDVSSSTLAVAATARNTRPSPVTVRPMAVDAVDIVGAFASPGAPAAPTTPQSAPPVATEVTPSIPSPSHWTPSSSMAVQHPEQAAEDEPKRSETLILTEAQRAANGLNDGRAPRPRATNTSGSYATVGASSRPRRPTPVELDVSIPGVLQPPQYREPENEDERALQERIARAALDALVDLFEEDDERLRDMVFVELLDRGPITFDALVEAFPGPLYAPRRELGSRDIPVEAHGPVVWLLALQLRAVMDRLEDFLDDRDADKRYYATQLLCRAGTAAPMGRLTARLFDRDDQVRATVIEYIASGSLGPQHADAISGVRGQLRASEPWVVDLAIGAVVHLGDTAAIPTLVELVGDTSAHTAQKAANALSSLTFQAHGVNQRRWKRWFRRYGNAGREAWLLDAMVDRDRRVRENAQRALRQLPWAVNYDPDLDRRQLKLARRAVEKYLEG